MRLGGPGGEPPGPRTTEQLHGMSSWHGVPQWPTDAPEAAFPYCARVSSSSLTRRRKEATRLDIARSAARLFAGHGVDQVTAETIAADAGVSLRTFYRYFGSKQEAVTPLLSVGAELWREALAAAEPGDPRQVIPELIERVLSWDDPDADASRERMRGLLRAAGRDPALQAVWHRVNHDSEARLRPIIAGLVGDADPFAVRLLAAAATDAIRLGLEEWAAGDSPDAGGEEPGVLAHRAFQQLAQGITLPG